MNNKNTELFFKLSKFIWKHVHIFGLIVLSGAVCTKLISMALGEAFHAEVLLIFILFSATGVLTLILAIPLGAFVVLGNLWMLCTSKFEPYRTQIKLNIKMLSFAFISCLIYVFINVSLSGIKISSFKDIAFFLRKLF